MEENGTQWENCAQYTGIGALPYKAFTYGAGVSSLVLGSILVASIARRKWRLVLWRWPYSVLPMIVMSVFFATLCRFFYAAVKVPGYMEKFCCQIIPTIFVFTIMLQANCFLLCGFVLLKFMLSPLDDSMKQRRSIVASHLLVYGSAIIITAIATAVEVAVEVDHCTNTLHSNSSTNGPILHNWMAFLNLPIVGALLLNIGVVVHWTVIKTKHNFGDSPWNHAMKFHVRFVFLTCINFFGAMLPAYMNPMCQDGDISSSVCRGLFYMDAFARGWVPLLMGFLFLSHPVVRETLFDGCCVAWQNRVKRMLGHTLRVQNSDENTNHIPLLASAEEGGIGMEDAPISPTSPTSPLSPAFNALMSNEKHWGRREVFRIRHIIIHGALVGISKALRECSAPSADAQNPLKRRIGYTVVSDGKESSMRYIEVHCPARFEYMRAMIGIPSSEVAESLEACMSQINPVGLRGGKSGQFCFLTSDGRFVLKTVTHAELKVIIKVIGEYASHIEKHRRSIITRFLGVFTFNIGLHTLHFVLMDNVVLSNIETQPLRFDLKGSMVGRHTDISLPLKKHHTFKDGDFVKLGMSLNMSDTDATVFAEMVESDTKFFKQMGLVDYSLLLAVFKKEECPAGEWRSLWRLTFQDEERTYTPRRLWRSQDGQQIFSMGIIDFLQEWTLDKKLEYIGKSAMHPITGNHSVSLISATNAPHYARRFRGFLSRISRVVTSEDGYHDSVDDVSISSGQTS